MVLLTLSLASARVPLGIAPDPPPDEIPARESSSAQPMEPLVVGKRQVFYDRDTWTVWTADSMEKVASAWTVPVGSAGVLFRLREEPSRLAYLGPDGMVPLDFEGTALSISPAARGRVAILTSTELLTVDSDGVVARESVVLPEGWQAVPDGIRGHRVLILRADPPQGLEPTQVEPRIEVGIWDRGELHALGCQPASLRIGAINRWFGHAAWVEALSDPSALENPIWGRSAEVEVDTSRFQPSGACPEPSPAR